MSKKKNRQATRSQKMLRSALLELLKEKPLHKIGISEITERADLARSTFYTHFETKEELLHCCIDETIAGFFEDINKKEGFGKNVAVDIQSMVNYFRMWSESTELIELIKVADIGETVIERLRIYNTDLYNKKVSVDFPDLNPVLADYYREIMIFANFGLIRHWIRSGMRHSPEVMGELLYEFIGPANNKRITKKFKDKIK